MVIVFSVSELRGLVGDREKERSARLRNGGIEDAFNIIVSGCLLFLFRPLGS